MTFRNVYLASALALAACSSSGGGGSISIPKDLGNFVVTDSGGNNPGTDGSNNNPGTDGGNNPGTDGGTTGDGGVVPPPAGSNQVAVVVDDGPTGGGGSANVGFVSVTLCEPGSTTNCATIDHVSVDTGSVGLRIVSSVIPTAVLSKLQVSQTTSGKSITECYGYADGFVFGTVRTADFTIGGETVAAMPFHAIGDKSVGAVPSDCSQFGTEEDTVAKFGGNGIIGVAPYGPDCTNCTSSSGQGNPFYYGCSGNTCTVTGIPQATQLSNPVSLFAKDNNGIILSFPDPGDSPAATLSGTMTFGIGTQSNNALSSSADTFTIADIDSQDYLDITDSTVNGKDCSQGAFFDSGTNFVYFDDSSLKACTGDLDGFYCPASKTSVPATNTDSSGAKQAFTWDVTTAQVLDTDQTDTVYKTIVGPGMSSCDWGLPFFYGKNMYVGIEGTTVTGATTPFEAY